MISNVTPVGSDPSAAASQTSGASSAASLDYDSFLRLFVAQLQNQDPMNPMEGTEYTAQLAQFSSLEQSIKSNEKLDGLMSQLSLSQANSLIGRTATTADGESEIWAYVKRQRRPETVPVRGSLTYRDSDGRTRRAYDTDYVTVDSYVEYDRLRLEFRDGALYAIEEVAE